VIDIYLHFLFPQSVIKHLQESLIPRDRQRDYKDVHSGSVYVILWASVANMYK